MHHSLLIWPLAALLAASTARADDWLAVLPECADEPPSTAAAELLYPRDGLPALVPAGEMLIARVRMALPLTPPPGVQQPRALEGLEAALIGHARDLRMQPREQRTKLEVVNVRPEGPRSLRYRLAVPVPAWLAPGTYDLELSVKGASLRAPSLVRVLPQGAQPRLLELEDMRHREEFSMLTGQLDAFVDNSGASARDASPSPMRDYGAWFTEPVMKQLLAAAPPVVRTARLNAALRVADRLVVIGDCETLHLPFHVEVESALRAERRTRVARIPAPRHAMLRGVPEVRDDYVDVVQDGWMLRGGLELSVLLPYSPRLPGLRSNGTISVHPAADVNGTPAALIVRGLSGGKRLLRVPAAPLRATLLVEPNPVRSGEPVRVRVRANRALAAVALRFDHLHTAYTLQPVEHRYRALGKHRVDGLAIGADGTAVGVHADVTVRTARAGAGPSCAVGPKGPRPLWVSQGLWLGALLLKRRRCRTAGNRLGAEPRSA